jgi:hypothetical protein
VTILDMPTLNQRVALVIGTLTQPLTHNDPDHKLLSNVTPIRRQARLVTVDVPDAPVTQTHLDRILTAMPVPQNVAPYLEPLSASEFLAVAFAATFIGRFRSYDGIGLFEGASRYERLAARMEQAARSSETLYQCWSRLTSLMQVGGHGSRDEALLTLLAMPRSLAALVLRSLVDQAESTLLLAREWVDQARAAADVPTVVLAYAAAALPPPPRTVVRQVPHLSGNSWRHNAIRMPGMLHMLRMLDIGQHELPAGVGFLLAHGGTIRKGAKAPSNENAIGHAIAGRYPFLALLGGTADAFFLPEGQLALEAHTICTENRLALARLGIIPDRNADSLLDDETLHRLPDSRYHDESPMPFSFETLMAGTQFALRCVLSLYASDLTAGALVAALSEAQAQPLLVAGGKSGAGYSSLVLDLDIGDDLAVLKESYEAYLVDHRAELRTGLLDGTLGSGHQVVKA